MMRIHPPAILIGSFILAAIQSGCTAPTTPVAPQSERARVSVIKPQRKTLQYMISEPGQIEGFLEAPLYAKLAAYVDKVNVDIGSEVAENAVLAVLKIPELQREFEQKVAAVKQAKAAATQAHAAVDVAGAAIASAKAKLTETQATIERTEADYERWKSESTRLTQLAERGSITPKAAEEAQNQLAAADAARKETKSKVDSAKAIVGEMEAKERAAMADEVGAQAKVLVAEADQNHASALLAYTEIRAPFKGVVTRRNVHPGHFVQPAEAASGKPLFAVARTDLLRAVAYVPEAEAPFVSVGIKADLRVPAMGNRKFSAKVDRTSIALDPTTRNLRVEMDLKNNEGTWRPGLYIYVDLKAERPDVLTVPAAALFVEAGQTYCAAVINGKIERKPVEVGLRTGTDAQIVSGLKETDQLVAKDAAGFRAGQIVEPIRDMPASSAAAEK